MSLNRDDPGLKFLIGQAKQDLQAMLDDIQTRILQIVNACTTVYECAEKLRPQTDAISRDLQTLTGTLKSRIAAVLSQYTVDLDSMVMYVADPIDMHYQTAFAVVQTIPITYGCDIIAARYDLDPIFPKRLKAALDASFAPVNLDSVLFFDWLEVQPQRG